MNRYYKVTITHNGNYFVICTGENSIYEYFEKHDLTDNNIPENVEFEEISQSEYHELNIELQKIHKLIGTENLTETLIK